MKTGAKKLLLCSVSLTICLGIASCKSTPVFSDKKFPVNVTIWHYYNGIQKQQLDQLVTSFNETVGTQNNIVVEAVNQGSINELSQKVLASLQQDVSTQDMPDVFAAYSDTVYQFQQQKLVADIGKYLTDVEKTEYVDAYLAEGDFQEDGSLYIFPVAKATEVFLLNSTDFLPFSKATGASDADFATWEGIAKISHMYYDWTDSQTPALDDGKAFFGRDAMANYLLVGHMQLSGEMFSIKDGKAVLTMDPVAMRRLWNVYYVPYLNGYYASYGRFRSDDVKTGDLIALVGSTSGAAYFPNEVTLDNGTSYSIEGNVYPVPNFEGTSPYAVQQGAGMAVLKSDQETENAAVTFLKWFASQEQNITFSATSGYLPVKKDAQDAQAISSHLQSLNIQANPLVQKVLEIGIETTQSYALYIPHPFEGGNEIRIILETSLQQKAEDDRKSMLELMTHGATREDAVRAFDTDANFENWFSALQSQLNSILEASDMDTHSGTTAE